MATLINKDKQISRQRQEFVEHNFEAMVGARKRRYNDTQAQKKRTKFFEDYYLLYTRNKQKLDQQKAMWNKLKEWIELQVAIYGILPLQILERMNNLEQGEKDVKD